jgi:hypothetical protein
MPDTLTRRQEIVLAVLASESAARFAPVQVQKLFFLVDENAAPMLGGKFFRFEPYNYGPFDADVYRELEALESAGLATISPGLGGQRRYFLTPSGYDQGRRVLDNLPGEIRSYLVEASIWVRSLSFAQLVGSIYTAYPKMRENSIFVG